MIARDACKCGFRCGRVALEANKNRGMMLRRSLAVYILHCSFDEPMSSKFADSTDGEALNVDLH